MSTNPLYVQQLLKGDIRLHQIPKASRTRQLCLIAVKKYWGALRVIPEKFQDRDICLIALNQSWEALKEINENKLDKELCLIALKQSWKALKDVPEKFLTYDLCLEIVKKNGKALKYVPKKFLTYDLYFEAIKQDGKALKDVPKKHLTYGLCLEAVQQDAMALKSFPKKFLTAEFLPFELCLQIVKRNGMALKYIPKNMERYAELYLEAVKQDSRAFGLGLEEFRKQILEQDNIAETMLRNGYDPLPDLSHLSADDKVFEDLDNLRKSILTSCNIIILQPDPDDHEAEDLQLIYAYKHGAGNAICLRSEDKLESFLEQLKAFDNKTINLAIIGHTNINSTSIAGITSTDIASLADNNPIIEKITLLGCETGASEERLEQEKINAAEFARHKIDIEKKLIENHPMLKERSAKLRLNALVNDILWHTGETFCGARVMFESSERKITPKMLMEEGLDNSLDSAYIFVKNEETNTFAAYYLTRGVGIDDKNVGEEKNAKINCHLISEKLEEEQVKELQKIEELQTGSKDNKKHLMNFSEEQAKEQAQAEVPQTGKGKKAKKSMDSSSAIGWSTNNKGGITVLKQQPIDSLAKILKHTRNIHFTDLPQLEEGKKRSYKRKVRVTALDKDFAIVSNSFAGKTVKAIQDLSLSKGKEPSVKSVKAPRGKYYPYSGDKPGHISTKEHVLKEGKYSQRFFYPERPKQEKDAHFINEEKVKQGYKKAEEEGDVKSVEMETQTPKLK